MPKRSSGKWKIQFLVTKRGRKFNLTRFSDPRPPYFGWFHFLLLTQYHFVEPKAKKNAKYRFWLQKGIKNPIWQDFLIRDPKLVGSFSCYFCLKMTRTLTFFGGGEILRVFPPSSGLKSVTLKWIRLVRKNYRIF